MPRAVWPRCSLPPGWSPDALCPSLRHGNLPLPCIVVICAGGDFRRESLLAGLGDGHDARGRRSNRQHRRCDLGRRVVAESERSWLRAGYRAAGCDRRGHRAPGFRRDGGVRGEPRDVHQLDAGPGDHSIRVDSEGGSAGLAAVRSDDHGVQHQSAFRFHARGRGGNGAHDGSLAGQRVEPGVILRGRPGQDGAWRERGALGDQTC